MEVVEAASTLGFLVLESDLTISFFMGSIGGVGVGGGLFKSVGVAEEKNLRRRRCMVDDNDNLVVLRVTALRHRHPLWYTYFVTRVNTYRDRRLIWILLGPLPLVSLAALR